MEAGGCSVELPGDNPSEERAQQLVDDLRHLGESIRDRTDSGLSVALGDAVSLANLTGAYCLT